MIYGRSLLFCDKYDSCWYNVKYYKYFQVMNFLFMAMFGGKKWKYKICMSNIWYCEILQIFKNSKGSCNLFFRRENRKNSRSQRLFWIPNDFSERRKGNEMSAHFKLFIQSKKVTLENNQNMIQLKKYNDYFGGKTWVFLQVNKKVVRCQNHENRS